MKKILLILISLCMILSFCACSKKDDTKEKAQTPEPSAPSEEEVIEMNKKVLLKFDKSWASKDYEAPVPEPPFQCVAVNNTEQKSFIFKSKNAKQVLKLGTQAIVDYCKKLKKAGYDLNVTEDYNIPNNPNSGYCFSGESLDGSCCLLSFEKGVVELTVMFP